MGYIVNEGNSKAVFLYEDGSIVIHRPENM